MTQQWQIVDKNGDVVVSVEAITVTARLQRRTPRDVARSEARNMVNVAAGDDPVFAVALKSL